MNVIKFSIEIERKSGNESIREQVECDFQQRSGNVNYSANCMKEWESQKAELASLYSSLSLVACQNTGGVNYYIFDPNTTGTSDIIKKTFEVLIVSKVDNIDHSFHEVVKHIRMILQNKKFTLLKANDVFLYPFNTAEGDIYTPNHIIKANFRQHKWTTPQTIRFWAIFGFSIFFFGLVVLKAGGSEVGTVFKSLASSGTFFCLTEIILFLANRKIKIVVDDLADISHEEPQAPYSQGEENLRTPTD